MKIIFRTDSSEEIGSGHLMRCLTLATRLQKNGASVSFFCRDLPGHLNRLIVEKGLRLHTLPSLPSPLSDGNDLTTIDNEQYGQLDSEQCEQFLRQSNRANRGDRTDWIIVDHYRLDQTWEKMMRRYADKIMVIDDLANRSHDCDLLLDQNLFDGFKSRYDKLTPANCVKLLGPNYAMLRNQFSELRKNLRNRTGQIKHLMIFFGASDLNGVTEKTLDALALLDRPGLIADIIIGSCNPRANRIKEICATIAGCRFHQQVDNMAELMAQADLAIGAGGSTTWERCCLGLPTLFVATSDNEIELAQTCGETEIGKYLGDYREVDGQMLWQTLDSLFDRPELVRRWGANAARLVDGLGAEKVSMEIESLTKVPVV